MIILIGATAILGFGIRYSFHIWIWLRLWIFRTTNNELADVTITEEITRWFRLCTILKGPLKGALLNVLHDATYGLPEDPTDLYNELTTNHTVTINDLVRNKKLFKDQKAIIFPSGDDKTYSKNLDITGIIPLITNCTNIPVRNWTTKPSKADKTVAANVIRARNFRNKIFHWEENMTKSKFEELWSLGSEIVKDLGHTHDMEKLKFENLDNHSLSLENYIKRYFTRLESKEKRNCKDIQRILEILSALKQTLTIEMKISDVNGFNEGVDTPECHSIEKALKVDISRFIECAPEALDIYITKCSKTTLDTFPIILTTRIEFADKKKAFDYRKPADTRDLWNAIEETMKKYFKATYDEEVELIRTENRLGSLIIGIKITKSSGKSWTSCEITNLKDTISKLSSLLEDKLIEAESIKLLIEEQDSANIGIVLEVCSFNKKIVDKKLILFIQERLKSAIAVIEPTIYELKLKDIAFLSQNLATASFHWKKLAYKLLTKDAYKKIIGEDSGHTLIRILGMTHPFETVMNFQMKAQKLCRNDISNYIDSIFPGEEKEQLLCNIQKEYKYKIGNMLCIQNHVSNWERWADEYGYSNKMISDISNSIKMEYYSYLLKMVMQQSPNMTIKYIADVCLELGRRDIYNYLRETVVRIKQLKLK